MLTVTTNHVPRDVLEGYELTTAERADFDYIDWQAVADGVDSAHFVRYRGKLHDLGQFVAWDNPASPTRDGWDGFRPDSFYSGLVIRYVDDFERVVVGLAIEDGTPAESAPGEHGRHAWDCACSPDLGPCADHAEDQ
jgi:hypothetical protein